MQRFFTPHHGLRQGRMEQDVSGALKGAHCAQDAAPASGEEGARTHETGARDAADAKPGPVVFHRPRSGRIGFAFVVMAILSGLATYTILTGLTPIRPTQQVVTRLLWFNAAMVFLLAALIGWQVLQLVRARRRKIAGASLHWRIVTLLSLFAIVPAVIVAIFASVTLNRGLDAWFSKRTQSIVDRSIDVAQTYIQEKTDLARVDIAGLASDLERNRKLFDENRDAFIRRVAMLAAVRGLPAVYVIDRARRRLDVAVTANPKIAFRAPPPAAFDAAEKGKILVMGPGPGDNIIRALKKLENFGGRYLYTYRAVNESVLKQLVKARAEREEFARLKAQRFGLQVTFALMYAGVTFIFLLAAIWFGLWFADRLVEPVAGLIGASRRMARGDLDVSVPVGRTSGDIETLLRAFNQMARQLKSQRAELLAANEQLDERRRFMEAVLAGVTAGVLGLDKAGRITLANRSAQNLLEADEKSLTGRPLAEVVPEMAAILARARTKKSGFAEAHVSLERGGEERTFLVRVTTERAAGKVAGYVVTFDDTTDLLTAQRNAAWADIARRIAHEIKNPLTPIQLSAERLKRRYLRQITDKPDIFEKCTETIIRQVGDIGRMVDEFSSFARMPSAHPEPNDLVQVVKEALLLQRVSSEDIHFEMDLPDEPLEFSFDRRLITQALTNLVKNAGESIEAQLEKVPEPPGRIRVEVFADEAMAHVRVIDNGRGLPKENRARLTEPYMTTREKGTGLGLAIVKRIMEEHGGSIRLEDAPDGQGAMVTLSMSLSLAAQPAQSADEKGKDPKQKASGS